MSYLFTKWLHLQTFRQQFHLPRLAQRWLHQTACRRRMKSDSGILSISDEVHSAVRSQQAVVALESTIITHGMPHPQNIETALEVEKIIRSHGCIPATVAVIDGRLCVGLTGSQIEWLGSKAQAIKASRRDLSFLISQGLHGGTTVSATMIAAHLAGVIVFATGGIGGIHQDVTETFDISADLRELGRTPVTVVSAGIKSILDIPKTLEYLETEGVGIYTYGETTDFPSFFTRKSGCQSPYSLQTPLEAAKMIAAGQQLRLNSGNLIAVPVPVEYEADQESINRAINTATCQAKSQGIHGKNVTPFILRRVNELMSGDSLKTNIALVKNNALVASQIAVALSQVQKGQSLRPFSTSSRSHHSTRQEDHHTSRVVVVGGINIDITATFHDPHVLPNGDTYAGSIRQSLGGVGRNIADGLSRLGQTPVFLSAIGNDSYKDLFEMECSHMDLSRVLRSKDCGSATYCAILNHEGSLINGIGDFDIHKKINRSYLSEHEDVIIKSALVIFDGNIPADSMAYLTEICHQNNIPAFFEPTTVSHVPKLFASDAWCRLNYVSPNLAELRMLHAGVTSGVFPEINTASSISGEESEILSEVLELCKPLSRYIPNILTTIGKHGVVLVTKREENKETEPGYQFSAVHMPVLPSDGRQIVSVSGAGDCLVSAFVTSMLRDGDPVLSLSRGIMAASLSLQCYQAVPSTLTPQLVELSKANVHPQWQAKVIIRS